MSIGNENVDICDVGKSGNGSLINFGTVGQQYSQLRPLDHSGFHLTLQLIDVGEPVLQMATGGAQVRQAPVWKG